MRRAGTSVILVIIAVAAVMGTALFSYRKGNTDGQATAAADRSAFTARGTVTGGQSAEGGRFAGGAAGGAPGGRAAQGSSVAGGGAAGTPGAGGGVTGKVTKVDGATLSLQQQPGNTTLTITTGATTTVTTFAAAAMSDLKTGDLIAVQGEKTGDTAYTATVLLALSGERGAAGGGGGAPGGGAASTAPAGTAGGQGRGPGGSGRDAGGFGLAGGGPSGRITKIDGATITLQGLDGTTLTVTTNNGTSVRKQTEGKVADIKVGDTIVVQGEKTGDTAYTARLIVNQGAS